MKPEWTGERLETHFFNEISIEHLHRYAIALQLVKGKKVLDIACGEGYGTKLLSGNADHVTGVDINEKVIEEARLKYKSPNIDFVCGSALEIPAPENSFDLITCFETIEHLDDHEKLIAELKRVSGPDCIFVISTPEKNTYSDANNYNNPFHKKELYGNEFKDLIQRHFKKTSFLIQSSITGSVIQNEQQSAFQNIYEGNFERIEASKKLPLRYWIAVASETELPNLEPSLFQYPKPVSQIQYEEAEKVKKTLTYKIGHILLLPFKLIRSIFKK